MRKALSIGVAVVCLVLVLVLTAWVLAQRALTAAGIEQLEWRGLSLSGGAVQLQELSGVYRDAQGEAAFELSGLRVRPGGQSRSRLAEVSAESAQLSWQPLPDVRQASETAMPDPLAWAESLEWLPDSLHVRQLAITLACPAGECRAQGELSLQRVGVDEIALQLDLNTQDGQLGLRAQVQHAGQNLALQGELLLADEPAMLLDSSWSDVDGVPHSQGQLQIPGWPQADWLIDYVAPWTGHGGLPFEQLPKDLQADLWWDLLPAQRPEQWIDFLDGIAELKVQANLPQAWRWAELGDMQGLLRIDVLGDHGRWQLREGLAELQLDQPQLPALTQLPQEIRPERINMRLQPDTDSALDWATALPLAIEIDAKGATEMSLAGRLLLSTQPVWQAEWDQLVLSASTAGLVWNDLQVRGLSLNLPLSGKVDAEQLAVRLGTGAVIRASALTEAATDLQLRGLRLDVAGLQLALPISQPGQATAKGRLDIAAENLAHDLLKPQSWTFNGELGYSPERIGWRGTAQAASGLNLDLDLALPADRPWSAAIKLQEVFLRAANPLAATFADWPALLSFASGRLTGQFQAGGASGLDQLQGQLNLTGGKGIYDRATFEGLTTAINVSLKGDNLHLRVPDLRVDALDPGLPLGPLNLSADYSAELGAVTTGKLELVSGRLGMLGGQLRVSPATLDLALARQSLVVELEGIELTRLFEVYPAEGLSGRGTLDGRLPVSLEGGKLLIDSGQLQAREPGGFLRYRSDKLQDLARSNIGMRQVAEALDDFHYSVLSSDVAYDQDGLLVLGLQLQGRNPALEGGRPIHLNIQLEENVPALLTSLQLSGQVSDIIRKRVQERLLQQRLAPDP